MTRALGSASSGRQISWTSAATPTQARARSSTARLPTTNGRASVRSGDSPQARAITSGPTPATSPIVRATSGLVIAWYHGSVLLDRKTVVPERLVNGWRSPWAAWSRGRRGRVVAVGRRGSASTGHLAVRAGSRHSRRAADASRHREPTSPRSHAAADVRASSHSMTLAPNVASIIAARDASPVETEHPQGRSDRRLVDLIERGRTSQSARLVGYRCRAVGIADGS